MDCHKWFAMGRSGMRRDSCSFPLYLSLAPFVENLLRVLNVFLRHLASLDQAGHDGTRLAADDRQQLINQQVRCAASRVMVGFNMWKLVDIRIRFTTPFASRR